MLSRIRFDRWRQCAWRRNALVAYFSVVSATEKYFLDFDCVNTLPAATSLSILILLNSCFCSNSMSARIYLFSVYSIIYCTRIDSSCAYQLKKKLMSKRISWECDDLYDIHLLFMLCERTKRMMKRKQQQPPRLLRSACLSLSFVRNMMHLNAYSLSRTLRYVSPHYFSSSSFFFRTPRVICTERMKNLDPEQREKIGRISLSVVRTLSRT